MIHCKYNCMVYLYVTTTTQNKEIKELFLLQTLTVTYVNAKHTHFHCRIFIT